MIRNQLESNLIIASRYEILISFIITTVRGCDGWPVVAQKLSGLSNPNSINLTVSANRSQLISLFRNESPNYSTSRY